MSPSQLNASEHLHVTNPPTKLGKFRSSEVKQEMTETKGLDPSAADRIGEDVKHKGVLDSTAVT